MMKPPTIKSFFQILTRQNIPEEIAYNLRLPY